MDSLKCPHCEFQFAIGLSNATAELALRQPVVPFVCENCAGVSLLVQSEPGPKPRKLTAEEMSALMISPVWTDFMLPAKQLIERHIAERQKRAN